MYHYLFSLITLVTLLKISTRFSHHKYILCFLIFSLSVLILSPASQAQSSTEYSRNLILNDKYTEHFLSPYITQYQSDVKDLSVSDILNPLNLEKHVFDFSGSIMSLSGDGKTIWLGFNVMNRSSKGFWKIDFGNGEMGRFGLFKSVKSYTYNYVENEVFENKFSPDNVILTNIPINQKSKIILKFEMMNGTPATVPLRLLHSDEASSIEDNKTFLTKLILLIGMVFFFSAIALARSNKSYLFFTGYYIFWTFLLFIQNNFIVFNISIFEKTILASDIIPLTFLIIGIFGLLTARLFWHVEESSRLSKAVFFSLIAFSVLGFIGAYFMPFNLPIIKTILLFAPSIFIFTLVPVISIIQSQQGKEEATPFMFGWFIFLFGVFISALSISTVIQPVSSGINAVWYTLIPQAIFFILAIYIKSKKDNTERAYSKTFEIDETESLNRLRQSKENTEQGRLLKVIEQERKVLGELRKSEARRTEQMRRAKEQADTANRQKSAFLAVVSHEIRTPMTGIMGMVRMLMDSNLSKEQKEYAQTIQDSSDAMLALLNDILDFEKIEEGKMSFENISFDIRRMAQGVVTLMKGHASQKNIELIANIDENLPRYVRGDPNRLRQVLLNLTGNAVKFTDQGSVTVSVQLVKERSVDGQYEIYFGVADSGIGISKEAQRNLFKPFSQADSSISRKFGGTGLGLAISKGVIEAMGSAININSDEGSGSTFFFTLNMKEGQSKDALSEQRKTIQHTAEIKKILVVDDNDINQKVVAGFLSKDQFMLDTAYDAESAIEKAKENSYHAILMDIQLPKMHGDEATKIIRGFNKDVPIIALTGNLMGSDIENYKKAGMNDFLEKPIDPEKLQQTLANYTGMMMAKKTAPALTPKQPGLDAPSEKTVTPIENVFNSETLDTLKGHISNDDITEMVRDLIAKSTEIIESIQNAVANNDVTALHERGHELKGMAGNFGLLELSEQAGDLEQKAKREEAMIILSAIASALPEAQKRAEKALSEWINKNAE